MTSMAHDVGGDGWDALDLKEKKYHTPCNQNAKLESKPEKGDKAMEK